MFNLIKYEWLRRWKFFLAGILIFIIANLEIISQLSLQKSPRNLTIVLMGLVFAMALALFFDHIGRLYRSLFSDEGFLEFTLPLRGYQFLGAKILAVLLECIALGIFVSIALYVDYLYLNQFFPREAPTPLREDILIIIVQIFFLLLLSYIIFLLTIYLSMTLSKTIFASLKHGKLIAFGCFLVIYKAIQRITEITHSHITDMSLPGIIMARPDWLTLTAILIVLFISTSYLLDRKINL
ncbi:MAG: hypothetical protein GX088_07760 [Clostridia bacterium]|nr:hypothetical protein [Clostridia bacterium]